MASSLVNKTIQKIITELGLEHVEREEFCKNVQTWMNKNRGKFNWDVFNRILDFQFGQGTNRQNVWNYIIESKCYELILYIFQNASSKSQFVNKLAIKYHESAVRYVKQIKELVEGESITYENGYIKLLDQLVRKDKGNETLTVIIIEGSDSYNGNIGYYEIIGKDIKDKLYIPFSELLHLLPNEVYNIVIKRFNDSVKFSILLLFINHNKVSDIRFEELVNSIKHLSSEQIEVKQEIEGNYFTVTQGVVIGLIRNADHIPREWNKIDVESLLNKFIRVWGGDPTMVTYILNLGGKITSTFKKIEDVLNNLGYDVKIQHNKLTISHREFNKNKEI